ncbi:MAG: LysR family transcriptional regulator [Pseudomonadota bacterium]
MRLKEVDANLLVVLDSLLIDGSVTRAAERLGRSPSAISHALSNLRVLFNDDLFVRAGQKLVPTARAIELAPTVHIICSGIQSLLRPSLPFEPSSQERTIRIASPALYQGGIILKAHKAVQNEAPGIELQWRTNTPRDVIRSLREDQVDLAVTDELPDTDASDIVHQKLVGEPFVCVGSNQHPLAGKRAGKKRFCSFAHVIVSHGDGQFNPVEEHFARNDMVFDHVMKSPTVLPALLLARDGEFLVTMPRSIADEFLEAFNLVEIPQPAAILNTEIHLVWHRSNDNDECHQWVRSKLVECVV